jgi:hypothetical protein
MIERASRTTLHCDMDTCLARMVWSGYLSRASAEALARDKGWRKDKLGRNICASHPKLKGARR